MAPSATHAAVRMRAIEQRLCEIELRLSELRQLKPRKPREGVNGEVLATAQRHAREAQRHWQQSTIHVQMVRKVVLEAFRRAAQAHDQAADALERLDRAGVDSGAETWRLAEFHRTAAMADRLRAEEIERQDRAWQAGEMGELGETGELGEMRQPGAYSGPSEDERAG